MMTSSSNRSHQKFYEEEEVKAPRLTNKSIQNYSERTAQFNPMHDWKR